MAEQTYIDVLRTVIARGNLSREQTRWAFGQIMDGAWSEPQIAGLLTALASKRETIDEITGAAEAMREHVVKINSAGADVLDTCGTGGTGLPTFNVSTTAAFVAAGAGIKVAKHGNRTFTRPSGSADVLAELGVNINADEAAVSRCLAEANVCFCFAVRCHPAMKFAAPVRKALGVRTVFNLLGPLTNPAGARRQLMGVFDGKLTETIAGVLHKLGAIHAMVVHSEEGLDELSTIGATRISELREGTIQTRTVRPEDFGISRASLADLKVTSAKESAERIRGVLAGRKGPARDIVVLNTAAALAVADRGPGIEECIPLARQSIDSGAAQAALDKLIAISNGK